MNSLASAQQGRKSSESSTAADSAMAGWGTVLAGCSAMADLMVGA